VYYVDEQVSHPSFSEYSLRLKTPTLCDDSVKQYSGYLDIAEDKHLFFWSRTKLHVPLKSLPLDQVLRIPLVSGV
jgi:hypothetical protein